MGSASGFICKACGTQFTVRRGGGFFFDLLHCDTCGTARSVSHEDLGDIHLGFGSPPMTPDSARLPEI